MWQFGKGAYGRGRWVDEQVPAAGGGRPRLSCVGHRSPGGGTLPWGMEAGKAPLGDVTPEMAPSLSVLLGGRVLPWI